eukprot:scaffold88906_cov30-Tisochrysis_lutea.AAC.3
MKAAFPGFCRGCIMPRNGREQHAPRALLLPAIGMHTTRCKVPIVRARCTRRAHLHSLHVKTDFYGRVVGHLDQMRLERHRLHSKGRDVRCVNSEAVELVNARYCQEVWRDHP